MQEVQNILARGVIIQDRYLVEDMLGRGGFSNVYLVRDQQTDALFALKELIAQEKKERERFTLEGELLTRLGHPSLPRIHRVFEDQHYNRAYILMDYVEGPNLEELRKQQPAERFSLSQVLQIMAPILEAVGYLHCQQPPIVHRDVKPANIIVPGSGADAVLVDFGIAKEYHPDSTTTAIRHCSPGYGAPEQYSLGTDPRTDIYGLGATFYALLTGVIPIDAFQRATQMASKGTDPLVSTDLIVPTIPSYVARAIHRAMSIGSDKRFSTAEEFWQAVKTPSSGPLLPQVDIISPGQPEQPVITRQPRQPVPRSMKLGTRILSFLLVLVVLGVAAGFGAYFHHSYQQSGSAKIITWHPRSSGTTTSTRLSTTNTPARQSRQVGQTSMYPVVAQSYRGTIHDLSTNVTTALTLTLLQQSNERILGNFIGLRMRGSFTGVLDTSKHIFFTVTGNTGQMREAPLFFEGSIRSDDNLVGNYCSEDQQGQCAGNYGVWSAAPGP